MRGLVLYCLPCNDDSMLKIERKKGLVGLEGAPKILQIHLSQCTEIYFLKKKKKLRLNCCSLLDGAAGTSALCYVISCIISP